MSVEFEKYLGKEITLKGRISETPWQHMIDTSHNFDHIYYLDLEGGDQIVFYSKEPVVCSSSIKIEGKVIRVVGESKRPGSDTTFIEYQIVAEKWECL
ncbi:MAG: hypothetical protein H7645_07025 [Candidatus Heimdallarchaeota archaeon]|nr:hypothetical protein [Candidatus Heimdallarchaeota archaeon]MCK4770075.1 hypothetical protein [Candidatus Heimdallarchaeota archaeon]